MHICYLQSQKQASGLSSSSICIRPFMILAHSFGCVLFLSHLSRLSRCPEGETPETAGHFRDSGTVQMSHSSVTGVRLKSFIRLWISGKYSQEDIADCDVYFCGGDFFLGELGFSSGGEP